MKFTVASQNLGVGFILTAVLVLILVFPNTTYGQSDQLRLSDPLGNYLRFFSNDVTGMPSFSLRPYNIPESETKRTSLGNEHPWSTHRAFRQVERSQNENGLPVTFHLINPDIRFTHNNKIPWGINDGGLWQGIGLNQQYKAGIGFRVGNVSGAFDPEFTFVENKYYTLSPHRPPPGIHRRGQPLIHIDMPTRPGRITDELRPEYDSYGTFYPGESYIRYDFHQWAIGFSTQQRWAGPAVINPLLLSSNASGFAHGFISTLRPVPIPTGQIELQWFWGGLRESLFFDEDSKNDLRYISGFTLDYSPERFRGFHIGINRMAYKYFPRDGVTVSDLFLAFRRLPEYPEKSYDKVDLWRQYVVMSSIYLRHAMPKAGFEWYLEWGQYNYSRDIRDWLSEPDLNRAYTVGAIKRFDLSSRHALVGVLELTQLENSSPGSVNRMRDGTGGVNSWYTNDFIRQGYTHKGKVIGAGIGPGSNAQTLKLIWYHPWGYTGTTLNRTAYNNDRLFKFSEYYLERDDYQNTIWRFQEAERAVELNLLFFLPFDLEFQFDYRLARRFRFENLKNNDLNNTNLSFTLRYALRSVRLY